jgi:hypothetical protein
MPPRARGGRVRHSDEAQDKALIHKTLQDEGLIRSDKERARGGGVRMTAGAESGPGRLEKVALQKRHPIKAQAV